MKKTLKEQLDRSQELIQYDNSGAQEREVETSQEQNTWPNTQTARVRLSTCDGTTNTSTTCATIVPGAFIPTAAYSLTQGVSIPQVGDVVKTEFNPGQTYFVDSVSDIGCGPAYWQLSSGQVSPGYCCERACDTLGPVQGYANPSANPSINFWNVTNYSTCGPAPSYCCGGPPCGTTPTNYECTTNGCVADPNGQYSTQSACQAVCGNFGAGWFCLPPGGGGQGSCQYTPSMTIGPNGPFATESACETSNYCGGITSVDCTQYGVGPNVDQTTGANPGGYFDPQGATAVANGNCNPIQNKINQGCPSNWSQEKCDCRMDHLNFLLTLCQANTGGCSAWTSANGPWIQDMTDRYNGTGAPSGCNGLSGNNTNSVCGRKAHFCPGNTPSKQCKCDWLTTFTANNNCGC